MNHDTAEDDILEMVALVRNRYWLCYRLFLSRIAGDDGWSSRQSRRLFMP